MLLEAERCAIQTWSEVCDLTVGKDPRTYDMAARILNEEVEHEAWFIELLSKERDGAVRPSGQLPSGKPGRGAVQQEHRLLQPVKIRCRRALPSSRSSPMGRSARLRSASRIYSSTPTAGRT